LGEISGSPEPEELRAGQAKGAGRLLDGEKKLLLL